MFNHDGCLKDDILASYIVGELSAADVRRVEDHMDLCPGCAECRVVQPRGAYT